MFKNLAAASVTESIAKSTHKMENMAMPNAKQGTLCACDLGADS